MTEKQNPIIKLTNKILYKYDKNNIPHLKIQFLLTYQQKLVQSAQQIEEGLTYIEKLIQEIKYKEGKL